MPILANSGSVQGPLCAPNGRIVSFLVVLTFACDQQAHAAAEAECRRLQHKAEAAAALLTQLEEDQQSVRDSIRVRIRRTSPRRPDLGRAEFPAWLAALGATCSPRLQALHTQFHFRLCSVRLWSSAAFSERLGTLDGRLTGFDQSTDPKVLAPCVSV